MQVMHGRDGRRRLAVSCLAAQGGLTVQLSTHTGPARHSALLGLAGWDTEDITTTTLSFNTGHSCQAVKSQPLIMDILPTRIIWTSWE